MGENRFSRTIDKRIRITYVMLTHKIQFYGRRKGRKLSNNKNNLINLVGPKVFINKEFIIKKINNLSGKKYLEIGFGSGENLIKFAQKHPNSNFIGAEPYINSYVKVLKNIIENKSKNIKIFPDDIRLVINYFKHSFFDSVFLLHPDPWQKYKHKKRRILQQSFINSLSKVLKKNGLIIIATDQPVMKSWVLEQFHIREDFEWKINHTKETFKKPKFFLETKYSKKTLGTNNLVNWFFFKKK